MSRLVTLPAADSVRIEENGVVGVCDPPVYIDATTIRAVRRDGLWVVVDLPNRIVSYGFDTTEHAEGALELIVRAAK